MWVSMILTLDDLIQQVRRMLMDEDGRIWSVTILTECARLAMAAIQAVCPLKLSLAGLEDAEVTLLDSGLPALLQRLMVLYAWQLRRQQRQEIYHPDTPGADDNGQWLHTQEANLRQDLENLRLFYLQHSRQVPYAAWPDPVDR